MGRKVHLRLASTSAFRWQPSTWFTPVLLPAFSQRSHHAACGSRSGSLPIPSLVLPLPHTCHHCHCLPGFVLFYSLPTGSSFRLPSATPAYAFFLFYRFLRCAHAATHHPSAVSGSPLHRPFFHLRRLVRPIGVPPVPPRDTVHCYYLPTYRFSSCILLTLYRCCLGSFGSAARFCTPPSFLVVLLPATTI